MENEPPTITKQCKFVECSNTFPVEKKQGPPREYCSPKCRSLADARAKRGPLKNRAMSATLRRMYLERTPAPDEPNKAA